MGRIGCVAIFLALCTGSFALAACHEEFDPLADPDLGKRAETFGLDLSSSADDLNASQHPDLSRRDGG